MRPLMTTAVPIGVTSMRPLYSLALYANLTGGARR
jgi:hypothetical protein